jgi:hypothetical protein
LPGSTGGREGGGDNTLCAMLLKEKYKMYNDFLYPIKDYIYINERLIDNIFFQISEKSIFELLKKCKFGLKINFFEATIENEKTNENYIRKINKIYNCFKQHNCFEEPRDNFIYNPKDYYCIEKQEFVKVSLEHSKIKTEYDIAKINFYISMNRSFSRFGNVSPLFLLPDNINENIGMDGSSGYSIFKLLMEDYLECSNIFLQQIGEKEKTDFANNPIKFFKELGCFISDIRYLETIYKKRSILKDADHDIVYTFAYPIYIASTT